MTPSSVSERARELRKNPGRRGPFECHSIVKRSIKIAAARSFFLSPDSYLAFDGTSIGRPMLVHLRFFGGLFWADACAFFGWQIRERIDESIS